MNDFRSTASHETLKARAMLLRQTRAFFDDRGFLEVQTPILSADTVVDRHIDPVAVALTDDPFSVSAGRRMWLQTSPEFAMKRLLASGMQAIYQIGPAFRVGESGHQHNPEFTMLEWYRCGDTIEQGMDLLSEFAAQALNRPRAVTVTMAAAFLEHAGFDPFVETAAGLRQRCDELSLAYPDSIAADDWDTWFDLLFASRVQPHLGHDAPAIVRDYPDSQSALAQVREGDPPVAERFELFVDGVELANGYLELLDAHELLARNRLANQQRIAEGRQSLPETSRLVDAMRSGLPPCVGAALGFDRLTMLVTGCPSIADVIPFPTDRA